MKKAKRLLALLLGVVMVLAMSVTAMAGQTDKHTITITNADPAKQHTYEAYQVFKGDLVNGKLTNLDWGDNVNGDGILSGLQAESFEYHTEFKNATTAQNVADIIGTYSDNAAKLDAFASVVGAEKNLKNAMATSTPTENKGEYKLNVTGDGYYFVKDKDGSITGDEKKGESYSKYMLKVIQDETIEAKDDHLKPTKKIVEGTEKVDTNTAAIGDTITYEISIPMPKMDGYKTYFFQMNDTMDPGLTFSKVTSIKVAGEEIIDKTDKYEIKTDVKDEKGHSDTLSITYKKFIENKGKTGTVVVTYEATLNEFAELTTSNNNVVSYKYSNNPSQSGEGENTPGEPNPKNPTGETPKDEAHTWVTQLELLKTGDNGNVKALEGAKFTLSGEGLNVVLLSGTKFETAPYTAQKGETVEAGTYYLLKDGTYTSEQPEESTKNQYKDTEKTYNKVTLEKVKTDSATVDVTAITDTNGKLSFVGLKPGKYTLTENVAPSGYNKVDPIEFTIEWDGKNSTFKVADNDKSGVEYVAAEHTFKITVDNKSGATLPSTGGMGTTLFYLLGSILVLGAGVVLISRRRMAQH